MGHAILLGYLCTLEGYWLGYLDKLYMMTGLVRRGNVSCVGRNTCMMDLLCTLGLLHLIPLMGLGGKRY